MLRRIIYALVGIAIAAAGAWALWPKPVAVETAIIDRRSLEVTVDDEGISRIRQVFTVSAPVTGKLLRVPVSAGDPVIANQTVIASITPADPALLDSRAQKTAQAADEAAQAAVDLAAAQLNQAQAQLTYLQGELMRDTMLIQDGTITNQVFDKAALDVAVAQTGVEMAKANLVVQQRDLDSAKAALPADGQAVQADNCCIDVLAPVSGEVLNVATQSEHVVQAGTALVEVGDPADLEIAADLLSSDAVLVSPGAAAVIDGWGGPPLKAEVTSVEPQATAKVSALGISEQRVTVVLKLLDPPEVRQRLGDGFRVVAHITVWHGDNLIAVPIGALFRVGTEWAVFAVAGGAAHVDRIQLGQRNADYAEVKMGLDPGAVVILHPGDQISDGTKVVGGP